MVLPCIAADDHQEFRWMGVFLVLSSHVWKAATRGTALISVMTGGNHKIEQLLSCRCDEGKQHQDKIAFELCF